MPIVVAKSPYAIQINFDYCTGCGNCIFFCPRDVLEKEKQLNQRGIFPPKVVDLEACTGCKLCELYCGNFAIAVTRTSGKSKNGDM